MSKSIGDDLFANYRKYKGMNVDSPQYEPLENEVVSKSDIVRLRAREYAEKNKEKIKIKRLEKIVAELRQENKALKNNKQIEGLQNRIKELNESNLALLKERDTKSNRYNDEKISLQKEIQQKEEDFEEFKKAVRTILKFL